MSQGDKNLVFDYDYMSRRIRKRLYTHNGSNWQLSEDLRFVYDQWNPVLVLDGNNDIQRKYTWGLDLSLTMHYAGGVGGLLSVVETQDTATTADDKNYWFVYDGNGNVGQVLDATDTSDVSLAAHYEYDPYGDTLVVDDVDSSGYANDNPYRFSTKWLDDDLTTGDANGGAIESSGLYYYGYRYYSPNLGRWLSRDPIQARNLYLAFHNNSIAFIDPIGPFTITPCGSGTITWAGYTLDSDDIEYDGATCMFVTENYVRKKVAEEIKKYKSMFPMRASSKCGQGRCKCLFR